MNPFFYSEEAVAKRLPPLSPAAPSPPNLPPLRSGQFRLTIPNTYSTITMPASLRSDCCSPSLRNAVRRPSGIDVHLHRNTHKREISWQPLARTLTKLPIYVGFWSLSIAGAVSTCPTLHPQDGRTINSVFRSQKKESPVEGRAAESRRDAALKIPVNSYLALPKVP